MRDRRIRSEQLIHDVFEERVYPYPFDPELLDNEGIDLRIAKLNNLLTTRGAGGHFPWSGPELPSGFCTGEYIEAQLTKP